MRRYRLHALIAGLLVVVVLYLWRGMSSFLPRTANEEGGHNDTIEGHDLSTGFVRLLHRGIRKGDILETCFNEWKESQWAGSKPSEERMQRMEHAMMSYREKPMNDDEIVSAYRHLHRIWNEKEI